MTLRKAKVEDYWRHTFSRNYPTQLHSVKIEGLLCLENVEIVIPKGICAIVGGNGVGKSALLAAITELLGNAEFYHGIGHKMRLTGSVLEAAVLDRGDTKKLTAITGAEGIRCPGPDRFESRVHWIEPAYIVNLTQKQLSLDAAFSELLEPLSPLELTSEDCQILWYILGKKVDYCCIYEVTEYSDLDPFPYFILESGGVRYGSELMGYGELSLLSIYWKLRTVEKNEVLILEEPEAHVSPRSQRALMDVIAKVCDEKGLTVILTTHSPAVIANLPQRNLILLTKNGSRTEVNIGASKTQVNDLLGAVSLKSGLILVEDRAAVQFLISLLRELNLELLSQVDIVNAGSASNIESALNMLPKATGGWLTVIGAFDGDMRATTDASKFNWSHVFLPGQLAPEKTLQSKLLSLAEGTQLLADELHRGIGVVRHALDSVDGYDAHDWFTQLPKALGCEHSSLMDALVRIWLAHNRELAATFVRDLVKIMNLK